MGHDDRIPAGRKHARPQRPVDEREVGFPGQLVASERQLKATCFDPQRPTQPNIRVRIAPRRLFVQSRNGLEILTELAGYLERDPLEGSALNADSTILPVALRLIESDGRRRS